MGSRTHVLLKAEDRSYFAILKKQVHALAVTAGFNENKVGEIDIIVAEMVTNLVKHAGGGQLLVKLVENGSVAGIEIISIDSGGGISDVSRMIADGVSTKNTLGHGLGSMKRLSDVFQVYSQKDWGSIFLSRLFTTTLPQKKLPVAEIRSIVVPKPGEEACGDGFHAIVTQDQVRLFLGDGLGHGEEAAKAVEKAMASFAASKENDPQEIIRQMHTDVRKTRGLVGLVAIFDIREKKWRLCGVGNVALKINGPTLSKAYISYNGIIGLNLPKTMNAQEIAYEKGQHLVMCSDGFKSRWDTTRYTGLVRYDLSVLCAALFKDFARYTDDMSVAACKINL